MSRVIIHNHHCTLECIRKPNVIPEKELNHCFCVCAVEHLSEEHSGFREGCHQSYVFTLWCHLYSETLINRQPQFPTLVAQVGRRLVKVEYIVIIFDSTEQIVEKNGSSLSQFIH